MAENQREHFRVDIDAAITVRHVPKEKLPEVASEINQTLRLSTLAQANKVIFESIKTEQSHNKRHADLFQAMNEKMDYILSLVQGKSGAVAKPQTINLSSGGCRFTTTKAYNNKEIIDITVRFADQSEVRGLSYVVMVRETDATPFGKILMAVEFQSLIDSHRSIIDKKIMERQREMIIEKKEAEE
ncbi:MAG TPA: PilZ domain-containing protein [Gammaproteobacteria bacterium]|jgi:hypothetical protein|nr:PilZ domain-containing protein [Gammaproteobacteria bacterium]MBT6652742.1 PilZ domain-containing protein [Gammaproteobacteria bacterium]HIJ26392.1 PilZ domain-containing protein [Gammaproteobacteria bacterium]